MIIDDVTIETADMALLIKLAVSDGVTKTLTVTGTLKVNITKAEAYRIYGRPLVDRWLKEGLLGPFGPQKSIDKSGINRKKLEAIAAASNRNTYLPTADR